MVSAVSTTNTFAPLVSNPYGFAGATPYMRENVPSSSGTNSALTPEQLTQKLAYEWLNYNELQGIGGSSNPPFLAASAGRLIPGLNGDQRIVRGYIRRANYEGADSVSKSRLYFMYNPETIVRDYVSYLDQAALDPFNTVYGSNNLVAPPSFMNFRFDLFFDRQSEVAADINHPGVFVDYQYFDLVVRNVVPTDPNQANNQLPDNGVMMVNPRDITVVFSPQITVQGRPINAQIVFEKFSHRMTPVRMRISLEMRVVYIGPIRAMTEYTMDTYQSGVQSSVVQDDAVDYSFNFSDLQIASGASNAAALYLPSFKSGVQTNLTEVLDLPTSANSDIRTSALAWAKSKVREGYTEYNVSKRGMGLDPSGLLKYADCSSLVWNAYNGIGMTSKMGWGGTVSSPTDTTNMIRTFKQSSTGQFIFTWTPSTISAAQTFFSSVDNRKKLQRGDLFFCEKALSPNGSGHVAFFDGWADSNYEYLWVFDAAGSDNSPQVGRRKYRVKWIWEWNHHIIRPIPLGSTSYGSTTTNSPYTGYKT